jgi:hypothetical protein
MRIWIRNTAFFLTNLRFAICGLIIKKLRVWDLRIGTPQKFANLRLRNEPKNLRICDLRTNQKNVGAHPFPFCATNFL